MQSNLVAYVLTNCIQIWKFAKCRLHIVLTVCCSSGWYRLGGGRPPLFDQGGGNRRPPPPWQKGVSCQFLISIDICDNITTQYRYTFLVYSMYAKHHECGLALCQCRDWHINSSLKISVSNSCVMCIQIYVWCIFITWGTLSCSCNLLKDDWQESYAVLVCILQTQHVYTVL